MALPLDFSSVLQTFATPLPVTVFDSIGQRVDGEWQESEPEPRPAPLAAIVLAMNVPTLEFYREGDSSVSGITLHTTETLYFTDVKDTADDGQERRQSYVEYQGYRFRVVGTGFMLGNTNFNLYHCVRYVQ